MHLLAWAFAQQESLGFPKCARVCMEKAAPSAASWGCFSSTFSCLCENHWFADGYDSCVRQGCGVTDTYDAKSQFETQCNKLFQRDLVVFSGISPHAVTTIVPAVDTNPPNAYTPQAYIPVATPALMTPSSLAGSQMATTPGSTLVFTSALITPSSLAGAHMVTTPGYILSTTSTLVTPSSSPIVSSTSMTAAPSTKTSPPASGGVSQSAKIGIGLGVPLAVLLLALIVYVLYRYHRTRQKSRGSHAVNIGMAETYPAVDNAVQEKKGFIDAGAVQPRYKNDDPVSEGRELHGQHIPPYSRELEGSPGYGRKELPG